MATERSKRESPESSEAPWIVALRRNPRSDRVSGLGTLLCVDFGPTPRTLATGGSIGVVLWDIDARRVVGRLASEVAPVVRLVSSLDGRRLAALGQRGAVAICDVASGKTAAVVRPGYDEDSEPEADTLDLESAPRLQFSPDGESLLLMGEEAAWILCKGRFHRLDGDEGLLGEEVEGTVAGFSAAGEVVVVEDEEVSFHRIGGARSPKLTHARTLPIRAGAEIVLVSDDGRLLLAPVTGRQNVFAISSLETGDTLATYEATNTVYGARFARSSPLLFLDVYGGPTLVAFPERAGAQAAPLPNDGRLHDDAVNARWAIAPHGDLIAVGDGYYGDIELRDLAGDEALPALGRYIYDSDSAAAVLSLDARAERCVVLGLIGDGQNSSAWAQAWNLAGDRPEALLTASAAVFCFGAALVPGTELIALPSDPRGVELCDRTSGETTTIGDDDSFQSAAVRSDGAIVAAGSANGDLVLWDRQTGKQLARVNAHAEQICGMAWQPSGDTIATSSQDGMVRLWSASALLAEGAHRDEQGGDAAPVEPRAEASVGDMMYQVVFSADGALCAVGMAEGAACVIRVDDGEIVCRVSGHRQEVMTVAFHPRTGHLVTGSQDGTCKVWDVATGAGVFELDYTSEGAEDGAPDAGITMVGFASGGEAFVLGHSDGTIRRWSLPAEPA